MSIDLRFFLSVYFVELANFRGLVRRYFMNAPQSAALGINCAGQWIGSWVRTHFRVENIIQEIKRYLKVVL